MTTLEAAELLRQKDRILILTHGRPDGDTLGCAAALCAALRKLGKTAYVLKNPDTTETYQEYVAAYLAPDSFRPEFVVSVDIAALQLLPDNALPYRTRIDLAIDHHPSNEGFAAENCVDASCAACGEILYDICRALVPMDEEIALPLYVAVSTDTGCFVYSNTTPNTHRVAAELMALGDFAPKINKKLFRTKTFRRIRLEGLIAQAMRFIDGGAIVFAPVTLDMLRTSEATEADAEDLSAFTSQIAGAHVTATLKETEKGNCKISLRTDETLNATDVCRLLGGGGHAAASGALYHGPVEEAMKALLAAIRQVQGR